ncbi:MAG TPA: bifunctional phosphoserine phosphatase/homoserine phosphotransferase ThrH [Candidatus Eisenbacteria bacterium]|nr:bifunctional phosphoserine phosphatase/homoserine phosphotransferase ThrH [Candidatus Eisenbacteria bacterium]
MNPVCCLDLEGVLVPEIWINVADRTRVRELRLTTRDIPDYDVLMRRRIKILREKGIRLADIQRVIATMRPLPGAVSFLDRLRSVRQVLILSDTFYEFAGPLMKKLAWPTLFCNFLETDRAGFISGYRLRQPNGKEKAVRGLRSIGFRTVAAGDSFNDLTMLKAADRGVLFRPPDKILKLRLRFPVTRTHGELYRALTSYQP